MDEVDMVAIGKELLRNSYWLYGKGNLIAFSTQKCMF